jgi:hypothetical protein
MYVLENLWRNGISPSERYCDKNSEYKKLLRNLCEESEKVSAELSPEGKQAFEEHERIQLALIGISEEDIFVNAFRLGARMMLDVIGDYKGQFHPIGEAE